MAEVQEYLYTFRTIIPEKSHEELLVVRKKLLEIADEDNRPMIVVTRKDHMTISVDEDVEYIDMGLSRTLMIARDALQRCGITKPMFTEAYATPTKGATMTAIHIAIEKGQPLDSSIDLTDEMFFTELDQ